jgi:MFS family permease
MASPMLQEVFGGRLLGLDIPFEALDAAQLGRVAAMAAGFTGLLSLFNILGRFFWSSLSDWLGRKTTYAIFFLFGIALAVGFVCNALIRPVPPTEVEPADAGVAPRPLLAPVASPAAVTATRPANLLLLAGFWLFVAIPMGWGLWPTIRQTAVLFW